MKKQFFTICGLISCVCVCAATYMRVKTDDGKIVRYEVKHVTEVDFEEEVEDTLSASISISISGKIDDYTYVDLGLPSGLKWATQNLGSSNYYEAGIHYSWAEIAPDDTTLTDCYSWSQYEYGNGAYDQLKYVTDSERGKVVDSLATLLAEDDAATQNLSANWRTPSLKEQKELIDGCTWSYVVNVNGTGVSGMYGVSKANDQSIFLPFSGYRSRYGLCGPQFGWYWSADLNPDDNGTAFLMKVTDTGITTMYQGRHDGMIIRAVTEAEETPVDSSYKVTVTGKMGDYAYVELGLESETKWAVANVGATEYYEVGTHYSWAETVPDDTTLTDCYSWNQYKWGSLNNMTKYVTMESWGTVDNDTIIMMEDDAATQNLGSEWRTPSISQLKELYSGCTWTYIDNFNNTGISGMYGVSKNNGNTIFLPAAGYRARAAYGLCGKGYGWYWSNELNQADNGTAYLMKFTEEEFTIMTQGRHDGMIVRAVVR